MPKRISAPKRTIKIYLAEHREKQGLTQKALAKLLRTTEMTVSRWERGEVLMTTDTLAAVVFALWGEQGEPEDLYHHPDETTPNRLLRGQPDDIVDVAMKMLRAICK
jgi:transcriptional regulator with XRE-family HTH domain